jgi:hypothetical protein
MRVLTDQQEQAVFNRIAVGEPDACWIWKGIVDYSRDGAPRPIHAIKGFRGAWPLPVVRFLYERAHQVTLKRGIQFHYCPLEDRCVNPAHNYPRDGCRCDGCTLRERNKVKKYTHSQEWLRQHPFKPLAYQGR